VRRIGVRDTRWRDNWKIFLPMRNKYGSREAVSIDFLRGILILAFFIALQMVEAGSAIFGIWNLRRVPYMRKMT
jgi:hypothetical protein